MPKLNYDAVGGTRAEEQSWTKPPTGYRPYERTVCVGRGQERWDAVATDVLNWQVKTRSGFIVEPVNGETRARAGAEYRLIAKVGPLKIREPVKVINVVDLPTRCGFSYGTLHGHPVSGEEAFITHTSSDEKVWLTLRSLTRPAPGTWRWVFPALLIVQKFYRRRYLRAMRPPC